MKDLDTIKKELGLTPTRLDTGFSDDADPAEKNQKYIAGRRSVLMAKPKLDDLTDLNPAGSAAVQKRIRDEWERLSPEEKLVRSAILKKNAIKNNKP